MAVRHELCIPLWAEKALPRSTTGAVPGRRVQRLYAYSRSISRPVARLALLADIAAVYDHVGARDKGRLVRRKPADHVCDLVGLAEPVHRVLAGDEVVDVSARKHACARQ